ncbi:hypothetical protein BK133_28700 [Paenibacillus sp. FSL H8-0548]|uniref:hypothetical protein n=1 Tax=Paenibacillus sp. FSL H8-0548 TaxID=1920422 RepID=UPI00096FAD84|nr:hypothetical protein [Paenibacillus sp. FSL H8-0548]OMF21252.1 hypothetical protein BK133_28700 [Paenibacillus sp. FSL H8-0548]
MSERHARKKRRPRFRKPDRINIILGSFTVLLLFAWGGLHWKESTQQSLVVNAGSAAMNSHAELLEVGLVGDNAASTSPPGVTEPIATDQADKPAEQPGVETTDQSKSSGQNAEDQGAEADKSAVEDKTSPSAQTTKPTSTAKPNQSSGSKPGGSTAVKPTPETTEVPEAPVVAETKPPIPVSEKYEQEIVQIQAKCTTDMNGVLAGADASMKQLDMTDPYAFQQLTEKWMDGLANAESACTTKFNGVIEKAANDDVDPEIIESWEQTFSALMLQLQGEFETKLLQLMGG